jgi:gas vesicle protein
MTKAMNNKKLAIGIAAGAALAGAAYLIYRSKSKKSSFRETVEEAKDNMKGKLNELQRKAEKEYKNSPAEAKETINAAKERANNWVNKASKA